jgi:hypothetical protein
MRFREPARQQGLYYVCRLLTSRADLAKEFGQPYMEFLNGKMNPLRATERDEE